jgi:hypothetical protein
LWGVIEGFLIKRIIEISGENAFKDTPLIGDIAMWTGHIAIVTGVPSDTNKLYAVAHVGSRTKPYAKEMFTPLNGVPRLGAGAFKGFWTPPASYRPLGPAASYAP